MSNKRAVSYKDTNKDGDDDFRRYGDFFIWKQILQKAKEESKDAILVTDDRKEDWWSEHQGKTLHPRPELIKEFVDETKQSILIYQSDRFIEFASEFLDEKVDRKVIDEIRALRASDIERKKFEEIKNRRRLARDLHNQELMIKDKIEFLEERRSSLLIQLKEREITKEREGISIYDTENYRDFELEREKLKSILDNIESEIKMAASKLSHINSARNNLDSGGGYYSSKRDYI